MRGEAIILKWTIVGVLLLAPAAAMAQAAPDDGQRVENICRMNPESAVCKARLAGKAAAGGSDLAAAVARGEGWGTSPITRSEILGCWATLTAIDEAIGASGQGNWPRHYARPTLAKRIAHWAKAADEAYADARDYRAEDERKALAGAREQLAGPNIVYAAEIAGNCKEKKR